MHESPEDAILNFRRDEGYTLLETTITLFIFAMIVTGIIALVGDTFVGSQKQAGLVATSDQARKLTLEITSELRDAAISNTGAYPIASAGDFELIFFSNIDSASDIERIRYFLSSGKIYKGVVKPAGNPLVYNLAGETVYTVQNNVANAAVPLFYYFDDTYDGTLENYLLQPVNINSVKFVRLNLILKNTGGISGANNYTVTAGATLRNLKQNLNE